MGSGRDEKLSEELRDLDEKEKSSDGPHDEINSVDFIDRTNDSVDFGGEKSLPPPPQLTEAEEKKLYRKIDMRYVSSLSIQVESY